MANHFQIPQGETFIPGYYYSNVELKLSNVATARGAYIGTVRGDKNATIDNQYIYYCASLDQAPVLVDRYVIPEEGTVYLLSTEYNKIGSYGAADVKVPAGMMAIYKWVDGELVLDKFNSEFSRTFTSPSWNFSQQNKVDVRTYSDWTDNSNPNSPKVHDENKAFGWYVDELNSDGSIVAAKKLLNNTPVTKDWPAREDITSTPENRKMVEDFNTLHKNYVYLWPVKDWYASVNVDEAPIQTAADTLPTFNTDNKYQYSYDPTGSNGSKRWTRIDLGAAGAKFNQSWASFSTHMDCSPASWFACAFRGDSTVKLDKIASDSNGIIFTGNLWEHLKELAKRNIIKTAKGTYENWHTHNYDMYVMGIDESSQTNPYSNCTPKDLYFDICHPGTWKCMDLLNWWWSYAIGTYIHATGGGESPVLKYSDEIGWACSYTQGYGRAESHSLFEFAIKSNVSSCEDGKVIWNIDRLSFVIQGPGTAICLNGTIDGDFIIEGSLELSVKSMDQAGVVYAYNLSHEGTQVAPKYFMPKIEIKMINAEIRQLGTNKIWAVTYSPKDGCHVPLDDGSKHPRVVEATNNTTTVSAPSINNGSSWIPGSAILDEP